MQTVPTSLTSLRSAETVEVEVEGPRPDRGRTKGDSKGAVCVERKIWRGGKVYTVTMPTVTTSPR